MTVDYQRWGGSTPLRALRSINLTLETGQCFGLVGESGSGKTTLARVIVALQIPTSGSVQYDGIDPFLSESSERRRFRQEVAMVFQDPQSSLNPRQRIGETVVEPLVVHRRISRRERIRKAESLLERVGLGAGLSDRFPHELSGGQRQRVGIARAISLCPRLLVMDEPVSALDVSVQAQILNLLLDLKTEMGITYLFIAHNLAVVRSFCDSVGVMKCGELVETAPTDRLFSRPRHPYTQTLLASVLGVRVG